MSDEVKPGLTAEEWEGLRTSGYLDPWGDPQDDGAVRIESYDGEETLYVYHEGGWRYPIEDRHGTAALCLHGQPFGFTREMLNALRDALGCAGTVSTPDNLPLAEQAADCIEALLPPEEM